MAGIQEAKNIHVFWQDKATARKIVESHDTLLLEPIDDITVEVDVVSYSEIDDGSAGQFAIRLDSQTLDIPSVKLANGTSMDLLPVTDLMSGLRWWGQISGECGFGYEGVFQPDLFL
jgi:hypothetical protein